MNAEELTRITLMNANFRVVFGKMQESLPRTFQCGETKRRFHSCGIASFAGY